LNQSAWDVVVLGAGIAGLTATALAAQAGKRVLLLEAHHQSGGCAGTFKRGPYTFDVGATQVAGLEIGGSHQRIFSKLGIPLPAATPLDPGCVVDLNDGLAPIKLWRNPLRWRLERQQQFPGSEAFWQLCGFLHRSNWAFASRLPILPPRNCWDLGQLVNAMDPGSIASGLFIGNSIADLLRLCGCGDVNKHRRLWRFLDLQLRLYSQEISENTAALYGATVLNMAQEPLGLWHLQGSMQMLSNALENALSKYNASLRLRHRVTGLKYQNNNWQISGESAAGVFTCQSPHVICSLPPQALPILLRDQLPKSYDKRLQEFAEPSGALVLYGAVGRACLPANCPSHLQMDWDDPGSIFVSISSEADGRAPCGEATVIASVFSPAKAWFQLKPDAYVERKAACQKGIEAALEKLLGINSSHWRHRELSTPKGFARWTSRPFGYVGGLGQRPSRFGPFGLASRSPMPGFWLCGDAIYPGEGTAGVSLSAEMAVRQLLTSA
jgi:C-3',4' desaturase CrtD